MNKCAKFLLAVAISLFLLQIFMGGLTATPVAGTIVYLYFFIALIGSSVAIKFIRKECSVDYLKKNYRNPFLFSLLIIGLGIGFIWMPKGHILTLSFAIWVYFLLSFLYILESRLAAFIGMLFLGYTMVILLLDNQPMAEQNAIYVFYFLAIVAVVQMREYSLTKNKLAE